MVVISFAVICVGFLCIPWLLARGGYIMMLCVLNSSFGELVSIGFVFVLTHEGANRALLDDVPHSTNTLIEDHPTPLHQFPSRSRSGSGSKLPVVFISPMLVSHSDVIANRSLENQDVWLAAEELVLLWTKDKALTRPVLLLEPVING
jgi:hypothetical protein